MDSSRFDAWVRSWGTQSRRGIAGLIAASGLPTLLTLQGVEEVAAKCVSPGKKCKKKNGKKKKCCGGAKCKGKKCKCQNGTFACGKNCCVPGQLCVVLVGDEPVCTNGPIPVGEECAGTQPGACSSGVCGCHGSITNCTCRLENCSPPGGSCAGTGHNGCCEAVCLAGNPATCSEPTV